MRKFFGITVVFAVLLTIVLPPKARAERKELAKIEDATAVLQQIVSIPEKNIPPALLRNAGGIAIIPGVIKAGFILGGRYGTGVLMVRNQEGEWSYPSFISLTGGSIGWQVGVESIDIILVFKHRKSIDRIVHGKFTLGADASVAAGPVGRQASAATDVQLKSEIYSYSRSRGLFAGLALEGAALQIDEEDNEALYGSRGRDARNILNDLVTTEHPEVRKLRTTLKKYTSKKK
ncbi:MAG: lipid-binding SYLF domain-containing protein [Candidatus Sulfobium sp.]|jgi:lipid-binding SYLF domain-containing protein